MKKENRMESPTIMIRSRSEQRGATLLEVLVTILVISIPMISLARLDSYSVRSSYNAFLRSEAILRAQEMAERMFANPIGVASGQYDDIEGIPSSPPPCLISDAVTTINCDPDEIAEFDAYQWNSANARALPSGKGTVSGPDNSGIYSIAVNWKESGLETGTGKSFHFAFRPLP